METHRNKRAAEEIEKIPAADHGKRRKGDFQAPENMVNKYQNISNDCLNKSLSTMRQSDLALTPAQDGSISGQDKESAKISASVVSASKSLAIDCSEADKAFMSFPERLMQVLDSDQYEGSIWWGPDGESFGIVPKSFTKNVLNKHFQGSKYDSFTRKLNRWGFKRVVDESYPGGTYVYKHDMFKRGKVELLKKVTGCHKKDKKGKSSPSSSQCSLSGNKNILRHDDDNPSQQDYNIFGLAQSLPPLPAIPNFQSHLSPNPILQAQTTLQRSALEQLLELNRLQQLEILQGNQADGRQRFHNLLRQQHDPLLGVYAPSSANLSLADLQHQIPLTSRLGLNSFMPSSTALPTANNLLPSLNQQMYATPIQEQRQGLNTDLINLYLLQEQQKRQLQFGNHLGS